MISSGVRESRRGLEEQRRAISIAFSKRSCWLGRDTALSPLETFAQRRTDGLGHCLAGSTAQLTS
jgi:hypothetical protein